MWLCVYVHYAYERASICVDICVFSILNRLHFRIAHFLVSFAFFFSFWTYWVPPKNRSKSRNSRRTRWFGSPMKWYEQNISFGYAPGYVGDIKTSVLFLCGVIVNEHGVPVIGAPISYIAVGANNHFNDTRQPLSTTASREKSIFATME